MNYGCIGEKLGHGFSREIHAKLFDYKYELVEVEKEKLDEFMTKRDFLGINVTIPYKQAVIPYLYEISDCAKKIGAVNTIVNRDGKLYGDNTDFAGMKALIELNEISLENKKVIILGSGGTSKTANAVAQALGAGEIIKVSRNKKEGLVTYEEVYDIHSDASVIINTTPCGMFPNNDTVAVDLKRFKNLSGVVDVVYNPLSTRLVCDAKKMGIKAVGGLYMLVHQAALAGEVFVNQSVPQQKIYEVYREIALTKQNVVLIGMPGCGKTTIGKILAEMLSKDFVDTDEEIEKKTNKKPGEIIIEHGEEKFREIEAEVIKEVSKRQNCVVATGGGAVLRKENVEHLKQNGKLFFIDRPLSSLVGTADRPLSQNRADLEKRYNERYDIYLAAADKQIKACDDAQQNAEIIKEEFYNENTCC